MIIKKLLITGLIYTSSMHTAFKLDPCAYIRQSQPKELRKAEGTQQMHDGLYNSVLYKPSRPTTAANPLPPLLIISRMTIYQAQPPKKPHYEHIPTIKVQRPKTAR